MATDKNNPPDWRALNRDWYGRIESAYAQLGHPLGFNPLLLSSVESFDATPRLLVATLNPAGDRDYPDHRGVDRYAGGNAYTSVDWKGAGPGRAPLQVQMQGVFRYLQERTGFGGSPEEFARARVVTAQIIPFRSPDEESLHRRDDSLAFVQQIWREIFSYWQPQIVVSVGATTTEAFGDLLGRARLRFMPTGWGKVKMSLHEFPKTRLLGLPHLSTFKLFSRAQSAPYLAEAFDWLVGGVK